MLRKKNKISNWEKEWKHSNRTEKKMKNWLTATGLEPLLPGGFVLPVRHIVQ